MSSVKNNCANASQADVETTLSLVKQLQNQASYRAKSGLHFIEGVRNFMQAIQAGCELEVIIWSDKLLIVPIARKLVRARRRGGCATVRLSPEQFRQISMAARASGVAAIVRQHWSNLTAINQHKAACWIALEQVRSPGNFGSLVRSSEALAGTGFILLGNAIDPFDPAVVRASMGAHFRQSYIRTSGHELQRWLQRNACQVVGASPDGAQLAHRFDYRPRPMIIMLGEERAGLSVEQRKLCRAFVRIPISNRVDSLNLAVAGSLLLYEAWRGHIER